MCPNSLGKNGDRPGIAKHRTADLPGNLRTAASFSCAKRQHMIRGQEREEAVMALRIFSTKKRRFT